MQHSSSSQNLATGGSTGGAGQRGSFYGSNNLYGGASSSNLYEPPHRRSSQYDIQANLQQQYPEPIYESAAPRQQKYLATSKSSSNLYLQPQYGGYEPGSNRSMGRQHKTLSMHGAPPVSSGRGAPPVSSGRNNAVMDAAASIIG